MAIANCSKCGKVFEVEPLPNCIQEFYYCEACTSTPRVDRSIAAPGIHTMSAAMYHSDPCHEPSLSSSIAKLLCLSSPAHARHNHPRLNPNVVHEESEKFDIGTCVHSILLEGIDKVEIIEAKDWRTNVAEHARDEARKAGRIPLLPHVYDDVKLMLASVRTQLAAHEDGRAMFKDGKPEQTLIWQEPDGTWCRARLDWLRPGNIDDLKTTAGSANPEAWTRTMFGMGFDVQVAFYLRGLKAITGEDATFRFAVVETEPPFALSVVGLGPDAMVLAQKRVLWALALWRECLDSGDWPAYPRRTCWAMLPSYVESAWLEKEGGLR